uniref:Reverse transcriptase zinc-binding domain-containing protein n=1 Tax=Tanacetum cinerariifolium TaxID=118510 RepID=A0A699JQD8_TANCI|nr:hypothetical protein [Tanacetum cinerariifolium]
MRYNERLSDNLKVADLIVNSKWNWPSGWEVKFPIPKKLEAPKIKSNKEDVKGRLQTQDRVAVWNLNNNMKCSMCNKTNDSHSNLFFECEYSNKIWKDLSGRMKVNNMANGWNAIDDFYKGITGDSNNAEVVLKMIIESVRTQMMGLKVRKTAVVDKVADIWDVRMNYLKTNGTVKKLTQCLDLWRMIDAEGLVPCFWEPFYTSPFIDYSG